MNKIHSPQKVVILYHAGCLDGVAAAAVVAEDFDSHPKYTHDVELRAVTYKDAPPSDLAGKLVIIVDFSWAPEILLPAVKDADAVLLIDHHASAFKKWEGVALPENIKTVFDKTKSGALLTWCEIHQLPADQAPRILKHVSDRDLWKFEYRDTKAICEYIMGRMSDLSDVDEFLRMYNGSITIGENWFRDAISLGNTMMHCRETIMHKAIQRNMGCFEVFGYESIPVANLPHELASDAGDFLAKNSPFAIIYEDNLATGLRRFSLRSNKNSPSCVNVRELAERMGGAGHDNAAGFYIPLKDIKDGQFRFFD